MSRNVGTQPVAALTRLSATPVASFMRGDGGSGKPVMMTGSRIAKRRSVGQQAGLLVGAPVMSPMASIHPTWAPNCSGVMSLPQCAENALEHLAAVGAAVVGLAHPLGVGHQA